MASKILNVAGVFVIFIAAALIIESAEAETHTVGGSTGWTNSVGAAFYVSWAANHTFKVGDVLVFQFRTGAHDVATLTKQAFDACNNTDVLTVATQGPVNYSLNKTGDYYFICAFPGHCSLGQKLSIKVTAAGPSISPTPSPSPSKAKTPTPSPEAETTPPSGASTPPPSPPPSTPAPPPSSASSLAAVFCTIFMSIAIHAL